MIDETLKAWATERETVLAHIRDAERQLSYGRMVITYHDCRIVSVEIFPREKTIFFKGMQKNT